MTDIFTQILLALSCLAVLVLIFVFVRLYQILTNFRRVSAIAVRRAEELDEKIEEIKEWVAKWREVMDGFTASFSLLRTVRRYFKNINKKGAEDEE